jgi:hypothetical protein
MNDHDPWGAEPATPPRSTHLVLVTEASVIRGRSPNRHRRLTDLLNAVGQPFILLDDVEMTDVGGARRTIRAPRAQVNLDAVLFAVTDEGVQTTPEFHLHKEPQRAFVSLPPYTVVGHVHLQVADGIRDGLDTLVGRFLPVTHAAYWSDALGVGRTEALMVAVNHAKAQILVLYEEDVSFEDALPGIDAPAPDEADRQGR